MLLEDYFNRENIIHLLCKYRVKAAKNSHKAHLLREISSSQYAKDKVERGIINNQEIISLLPPRRQWIRPDKNSRNKNDSQNIVIKSIKKKISKTQKIHLNDPNKIKPVWFTSLIEFVDEILQCINNPTIFSINEPTIRPIKKDEKKRISECRALSLYSLRDRIIISLTAKYLTDLFDPFFLDCSYAFRSTKERTVSHHDAITKILEYRNESAVHLWASECDIMKFFDCVNHEVVLESLDFLVKENNIKLDNRVLTLFKSYLNSYSFNENVYKKNNTRYFIDFGLQGCCFPWPVEDLKIDFYENIDIYSQRIGVPQGGAISCFIANLVMDSVDQLVINENSDSKLLYVRFCDDMIILHPEKEKCEKALDRYEKAVFNQKLLVHPAKPITNYSKEFWDKKIKSKKPYKWGNSRNTDNIPWISFVGYQIRYDNKVRIRKHSLDKEINKQRKEINEILKVLEQKINNYYPENESVDVNSISRKSIHQQVHAARSRLISMSVGRVKLHNKDQKFGLCWTNGFKSLNDNSIVKSQLKKLDRSRSKHLFLLKKRLSKLTQKPSNVKSKNSLRYYGAPFSYHYFLYRLNK
ncbi:reverse transcriptase/maturase family protein [Spirosoma fluminis]